MKQGDLMFLEKGIEGIYDGKSQVSLPKIRINKRTYVFDQNDLRDNTIAKLMRNCFELA